MLIDFRRADNSIVSFTEVVDQPSEPPVIGKLFRVRPDIELAEYGYHSRTKGVVTPWSNGQPSAPQTCPMAGSVGGSKPTPIQLPQKWIAFLEAINTPEALKWIKQPGVCWFNPPKEYPYAEALAMGSGYDEPRLNFVRGEYVNVNWIKVFTFKASDTPPDPTTAMTQYRHLIHRMNIVGINDQIFDGRPGGAWLFLISLTGELYLPAHRLSEVPI